jgi:hypothetical protein
MPARRRRRPGGYLPYPDNVIDGAWRQRGLAFHLMYVEQDRADQAERLAAVLRDRIETLIPVCLKLKDDVLYERNIEAFHTAWKVDQLIRQYCAGRRFEEEP